MTIAGPLAREAEPFAYVGELRAVPRLWSLWTGALEFSSLTLEDAHVNLTRTDGGWEFRVAAAPGLAGGVPHDSAAWSAHQLQNRQMEESRSTCSTPIWTSLRWRVTGAVGR